MTRIVTPTLAERFEAFVRTLDDFESIDDLLQGSDPHGMKRADYLLANRHFILEQKVLLSDPAERPQKFIDRLSAERGFRFYGTLSSDYILERQPDGKELKGKMALDLARVLADNVAAADKQTSHTRTIFNIPNAVGIIVILNEKAGILRPDVVHYALSNAFRKRKTDGTLRYTANSGVIVISEANRLVTSDLTAKPIFPVMYFRSPDQTHDLEATAFSESLLQRWAAFNNAPLVTVPVDVNMKPIRKGQESSLRTGSDGEPI